MSIDTIASEIFRWMRDEDVDTLKKAYSIANAYENNLPLQKFVMGVIDKGEAPGVDAVKRALGEEGLKAARRTTLPWTNIWSFVGIDLCVQVGSALKPGEHAELRAWREEAGW